MFRLSNFSIHSIFKLPRIFKGIIFVVLTITAIFLVYAQSEEIKSESNSGVDNPEMIKSTNSELLYKSRALYYGEESTSAQTELALIFSNDNLILRHTMLSYELQSESNITSYIKNSEYFKDIPEVPVNENENTELIVNEVKENITEEKEEVIYTQTESSQSSVEENNLEPDAEQETGNTITAFSGETYKYKKVINMRATAYTYEYNELDITASGVPVQVGVVAADFSVIPMNSKVYIVAADGSWEYGYAIVGDTGVSGNTIDLFLETEEECIVFGIKDAVVYILE